MHFEEHLLLGWHLSQVAGVGRRERVLVSLCAVLPDIDAVAILGGMDLYHRYHHTFGHALVGGLVLAAGAALLASTALRRRTFVVAFLAFLLHMGADAVGTRWPLRPLWPFSDWSFISPWGWWLGAWQNRAVLVGLLLLAIPSMWRYRRSPLELLNEKLDRFIVGWFVPGARPDADCTCGRPAHGVCASCETALCLPCTSVGPRFAPLCVECHPRHRARRAREAEAERLAQAVAPDNAQRHP